MNKKKRIMMSRYTIILSAIVSFLLSLYAPKDYSYPFCIICLVLFLICVCVLLKRNCKISIVKFEFFFTISFFFTNFAYPVIYYSVSPYFSLFHLSFPEDCINKGIALSTLGYSAFCYGILSKKSETENNLFETIPNIRINKKMLGITNILLVLLIFFMIPSLLANDYVMGFGEGFYVKAILDCMIYCVMFITFLRLPRISFFPIIKSNRTFFILICIYVGIITLIGNRGMLMRIVLMGVFFYVTFVKSIPRKWLFLGLLSGMCLMYVVGATRDEGDTLDASLANSQSIWDIGKDLTINARSQYVLIDYADTKGITWGTTTLMNILSVIPLGQSIFLSLTGFDSNKISSALLVTMEYYDEGDEDLIGLGTNLIGDTYVAFGFAGVIFLMFGLGRVLRMLNNKIAEGHILPILIYAIFFQDVILYCRSGILTPIRSIVWTCMLLYIFYPRLTKANYKLKKKALGK